MNRCFSKISVIISAGIIITFLIFNAAAGDEPEHYIQKEFMIGMWVPPPMDDNAKERYEEIAEGNFNLVIGIGDTIKQTEKQIKLCKKNDLNIIVNVHSYKNEQYPTDRNCIGYSLKDEPHPSEFAGLAEIVEKNKKEYPGKLSFINLLPNGGIVPIKELKNYDEYLSRFMETVKPEVLCMDHYPEFKPDRDGRRGYIKNLEAMREYSLKYDIPFWNFFNIMPYGPHTDPTEGQIKWQIYSSLAYGAKGVLYFCYFTPRGDEFPKGGAIINVDGTKTRHYEEAKRINAELKNMGRTLMNLTSTGVYRIDEKINKDKTAADILKDTPIKNISRIEADQEMDYLIGVFKHSDGREAVLINNYYFAFTAWPTVEFEADQVRIKEIDKSTGKEIPLKDDSPDMPGLQLSLGAGEGRLFLID